MSRTVTITGGSGFVGQLLQRGLSQEGYEVNVFDQLRGPVVNLLRRRRLIDARSPSARRVAVAIRTAQSRAERTLRTSHLLRPGGDDVLADQDALAARFAGSQAVVHLAGIPHPHWPGASAEDFLRLNYDASVGVFEAARQAGVPVFVFASSAQVYMINNPPRIDQLPILESNHLPLPAEGQSAYGFLKGAFERYLGGRCLSGSTQAVSLRLECPGFRSTDASNLYVSTSIENLVGGFSCALSPPDELGFGVFNIADLEVDPGIVDIQSYARTRWPYVPNHTHENECLLSTESAREVLGYRPLRNGHYIDAALVW